MPGQSSFLPTRPGAFDDQRVLHVDQHADLGIDVKQHEKEGFPGVVICWFSIIPHHDCCALRGPEWKCVKRLFFAPSNRKRKPWRAFTIDEAA
jgi:hypothetical protein